MAVIGRLGSVQFDPLGVAGRNHDLVLHARVAGYRPAWTDALLYERRVLFEAYNKSLCILPIGGAALVPHQLGPGPGAPRGRRLRGARRPRPAHPRADPDGGPAQLAGLRARAHGRLVLGPHQSRAGDPGGALGVGPAGLVAPSRQPALLRPPGAALPGLACWTRRDPRWTSRCATSCCRATGRTACSGTAGRRRSGSASGSTPPAAGAPAAPLRGRLRRDLVASGALLPVDRRGRAGHALRAGRGAHGAGAGAGLRSRRARRPAAPIRA